MSSATWILSKGMKIGEVAQQVGVSTKTIRYYESIGLLAEPDRTESGYRQYGHDVVERLTFVKRAQATGLSLDEIRSILDIKDRGGRSCDHTRTLLAEHLRTLEDHIEQLQRAQSDLRRTFERAAALDPSDCVDPHRCQVIDRGAVSNEVPPPTLSGGAEA